jgi:hypothetical protein
VITVVGLKPRRSVAMLFALPPPMKSRFGTPGETQRQSRSRKSFLGKLRHVTNLEMKNGFHSGCAHGDLDGVAVIMETGHDVFVAPLDCH